jgi:SepF-like predicted cell division protein (DUF552 family)
MGFMDVLRKLAKRDEEQVELPIEHVESEQEPAEKVMVRVENLTGVNDVERIERLLKQGNILFLKISDLQRKDLGQFKQTVQMLKRRCIQFGWDIVGIEGGYMVLTPKFAKIVR